MNKTAIAKVWFGIIAIQVAIVIPIRVVIEFNNIYGQFDTPIARSLNVLLYFTNLSNILVAIVSILLVTNLNRNSHRFEVVQLSALVSIIVAGLVYWLVLAGDDKVEGIDVYTNFAVHTTVPIMFVLGWIFFVQHGNTTLKTIKFAVLFPVGWAIMAMIRGSLVDWYPYPFMDVRDIGYSTALINMTFVTIFFLALFFGVYLVDNKVLNRINRH